MSLPILIERLENPLDVLLSSYHEAHSVPDMSLLKNLKGQPNSGKRETKNKLALNALFLFCVFCQKINDLKIKTKNITNFWKNYSLSFQNPTKMREEPRNDRFFSTCSFFDLLFQAVNEFLSLPRRWSHSWCALNLPWKKGFFSHRICWPRKWFPPNKLLLCIYVYIYT